MRNLLDKMTLTKFIVKNQAIITAIALFGALATFFISFMEKDPNKLADDFLPFVTFLIVITLVIYLYFRIEKIKEKDKPLQIFRTLLLTFLFFIILFILEYFDKSIVLIKKLFILIFILYIFLWLFKRGMKNNWFHGQKLLLVLIISLYILLSIMLILGVPGCIINEYIQFLLLSIFFSIFIFLLSSIGFSYASIFDLLKDIISNFKSQSKKDKKKFRKTLALILFIILISLIIASLIIFLLPEEKLVKFIVDLILLPKKILCSI